MKAQELELMNMSIRLRTSRDKPARTGNPALIFLMAVMFLGGCAPFTGSERTPPPVTVSEIIQLSKKGVPVNEIIEKMRASHTVYRLAAAQLAQLHDERVPDRVINYMQRTYLRAVRQDQRLKDWDYWRLGADGFWYGGPYYGWPPDEWIVGEGVDLDREGEQQLGENERRDRSGEQGEMSRGAESGEQGGGRTDVK
jgi:hypothetical protein